MWVCACLLLSLLLLLLLLLYVYSCFSVTVVVHGSWAVYGELGGAREEAFHYREWE